MTVTVALDLTELYDFDSVTGVTCSQGSPGLDSDFKVEGGGSVAAELRSVGVQWIKYTRPSGSWDLQNTHIYIWMNCIFASLLANKANGGLRILVGDGTNVGYWYCEGSDTYEGGFICLVADTSQALDSGSCTLSAVTEIGIGANFSTGAKNVESTWVDIARYGDGITVTSDALCDLDDILAEAQSNVNASGIIRKAGGSYCLQGKLRLGDDAGTGSITFEDKSQIIIFEDKKVSSSLYEIVVQGNATGSTSVKFGEKIGTSGVSGCFIKSVNPSLPFKLTASDPDIDTLGLYGTTFDSHGIVDLPPASANREVLNCSFSNGQGQVQPNTIKTESCNFISCLSSLDGYVLIESVSHGVKDCNFINNNYAVEFESALTVTFDNLKFSGCTTDINNTSGGAVIVNCVNGSNPSTYTGDTTINNSVYLIVYVKDEGGLPIENAQTAMFKQSDDSQLMNEDTDVNGKAEETFNYTSDIDVYIRVRKSSPGATRYKTVRALPATITSIGLTMYIMMVKDPVALP